MPWWLCWGRSSLWVQQLTAAAKPWSLTTQAAWLQQLLLQLQQQQQQCQPALGLPKQQQLPRLQGMMVWEAAAVGGMKV
jgi:hypothetical protein